MSKSGETLYMVTLKHLARDGKKASADLPEVQLSYLTAKQLRGLIDGVAALVPAIAYPVEPELRIAAPEGKFVVQVKGGKLSLVSWSSAHKGGEYSAARIYSIITGEEAEEAARAQEVAIDEPGGSRNKLVIALLIVGIVAVNAFTIWFVSQPKKTLLPKYAVLAADPAERLLGNVAGFYETGSAPGDRRLEIDKAGKMQRYKFGPERALTIKQSYTLQPADAGGKPAIIANGSANRKALLTIKDPVTIVLYGDLYHRVQR